MKKKSLIAALVLMAAASLPALADEYGRHPFYLHALSDLRTAAWKVEHRRPEDGQVLRDEQVVVDEIHAAIADLQHAAWLDGKPVEWREPTDAWLPRQGRHPRRRRARPRLAPMTTGFVRVTPCPASPGARSVRACRWTRCWWVCTGPIPTPSSART